MRERKESFVLKKAAKDGDADAIAALSSTSELAINEENHSALTLAAFKGQLDKVKLLLKNGEEVDHKTNTENTPLTLAASKGFFDVVTALIIYGANVNHETHLGI